MTVLEQPTRIPTLLEACDDERFFGVALTPEQRAILAAIETGGLLHVLALGVGDAQAFEGRAVHLQQH